MRAAPSGRGWDGQRTAAGASRPAADDGEVLAVGVRIHDAEWTPDPRTAERMSRLGSALVAMAQDLAASNRENRRLCRENAALRREIEHMERRCRE